MFGTSVRSHQYPSVGAWFILDQVTKAVIVQTELQKHLYCHLQFKYHNNGLDRVSCNCKPLELVTELKHLGILIVNKVTRS